MSAGLVPLGVHLKHSLKQLLPTRAQVRYLVFRNSAHYPHHVFIEPTTRCNLKCVHCGRTYWKDRDPKRDLSFDLYAKIVRQLKEKGVGGITLQGAGEPLLHKNIFEMIDYAHELGLYTRINTNLAGLTDEEAERLVRSRHGEIKVSIESNDPDVFADIRRGTTLEQVIGNIRKIGDAKKRLGSDFPQIYVNTVLMKATLKGIPEFVAEMKRIGVTQMDFSDLNTDGLGLDIKLRDGSCLRDNTLSTMLEEEVTRILDEIKGLADEQMAIFVPGDFVGRKSEQRQAQGIITCADMWELPYVDSAGRVTPCCWLPDGDIMTLGDFNTETFDEIWFGERYEQLRRQHLTNRHPKECARCQQLMYTVAYPRRLLGGCRPSKEYTIVFLGKRPAALRRG